MHYLYVRVWEQRTETYNITFTFKFSLVTFLEHMFWYTRIITGYNALWKYCAKSYGIAVDTTRKKKVLKNKFFTLRLWKYTLRNNNNWSITHIPIGRIYLFYNKYKTNKQTKDNAIILRFCPFSDTAVVVVHGQPLLHGHGHHTLGKNVWISSGHWRTWRMV